MKKIQTKNGFSLIELLVVMTIIGIIATIGMVNFTSASKSARDGRRKVDLETVRQGLVLYRAQTNTYPVAGSSEGSYNSAVTTLSSGYLSSPTPVDPRNKTNATGQTYSYTYEGTASTFCVCAAVELTNNGNAASRSCASLGTSGAFYCVRQP
jgi:prepilin-type N-terminal cleavage/methylation domain-containing protein